MDSSGTLQWWSRLYHEVRSDGSQHNSSPDQYVDGLAIDYSMSLPNSRLVVNARAHGNNVESLWEGNSIEANSGTNGFQNRFTGTSGNIHISWLGKLDTNDGSLYNSTYVAELGQTPTNVGAPLSDPLMDGWPNPNSGWLKLNTTTDGSVIIIGVGRRPMTTSSAYQKS